MEQFASGAFYYYQASDFQTVYGDEGRNYDCLSVLRLEEGGNMVIRGTSTVIKVPMMVKFYNQLQMVDVWVACATDEFKEADYQSFNLSMGQYMDSMELAMYC